MKLDFLSKSLKNKLIVSHIATIIIIIILIEVTIFSISVFMQLEDARSFDSQMVNQISNSLDSMITSFKQVCNYVSANREIQKLLHVEEMNDVDKYYQYTKDNMLQSIAVEQTIFTNELDRLYLYDKHSLRVSFKRYYTQREEEKFSSIPDVERFDLSGKVTWRTDGNTVSFNRAIRDLDSLDVIGYLIMTMNKNYIEQKINAIRSNQKRFIIVTDEFDNIIVHNYQESEQKLSSVISGIKYSEQQQSRIQNIEFIGRSLVTTHQSKYSGWKIISIISISELIKGPSLMVKWIFYVGIIGLAIGIFISLLSSNNLVKPLNSLKYLMDEVEKENFDVKVMVSSNDELGRLEKSFNSMVLKINNLIKTVYQEEIKLKEAEIKALQAQINPHFLYNTLDCINWLAEFGKSDEIRCVTIALASLMKASANNKQKMITVASELENIEAYLSIYKISLQNKFQYYIDIDDSVLGLYIPKLILQPLVENAIIHGIKRKIGQGNLHIKGFRQDDKMIFQIFDDGVGMNLSNGKDTLSTKGIGSGMANVKERIKLIYGEQYGMHIESEAEIGTMVEVTMPIERKEDK